MVLRRTFFEWGDSVGDLSESVKIFWTINEMYFGTFCKNLLNGFIFSFQFPAWQTRNSIWFELETHFFGRISPWNIIAPRINIALICASHDYIGNASPKTAVGLVQINEYCSCDTCSYHTSWFDDNMHVRIQFSTIFPLLFLRFSHPILAYCAKIEGYEHDA